MTKPLLIVFLMSGAVSFSDIMSYVTSSSLARDIQNCLFDKTQGIFYATTTAATGQPGIVKSTAPVGSSLPSFSSFNSNTVGKEYRDIVMVNDKTTTLPVTLAATLLSSEGKYDRFVVTHASAYAVSEVVYDSSVEWTDNPYGIYAPYAPYASPYGVAYVTPDAPYIYGAASSDSEIIALAATSNAVFSLAHIIGNDHLLLPGTVINVHGVDVMADSITIQSTAEAHQTVVDSRDFILGSATQVYDASNTAQLCYNHHLKTLYCAPKWITSSLTYSGSMDTCSVAAYRFDSDGLTLAQIPLVTDADGGAFLPGTSDDTSLQNIVGVSGAHKTLSVHQMGVMHTSKNKYHLIVLGGHGAITATGNNVYALPLVGPDGDCPGALANKSLAARDTRANNASDLYTASFAAAHVGNGALPWDAGDNDYTMVVVDDTVYVAVGNATVTTPGIYYSQAQFDSNGNIVGWEKWNLAAPRALGSVAGGDDNQGAVYKFAVNTVSGKIWVVPSDNTEVVRVPSWIQSEVTRSRRGGVVSRAVIDAARTPHEKVFDTLKDIKATYEWTVRDDTADAVETKLIAFVGTSNDDGKQKVVVIRSTHDDTTTTDENFRIIDAPSQEPILSVCFLQSPSEEATGILLVGTRTGLHAYLNAGRGGYVDGLGVADTHDLSAGHWDADCTWQQVHPSIFSHNISKIDCLYNDLYITQRSRDLLVGDTLHRIALSDIATNKILSTTPVLLFTANPSGTIPFILNHAVLPNINNHEHEQLVIGTYAGAHTVTWTGGIQSATNGTSLTITPITGTESHRICSITRTGDTGLQIVGQGSNNTNADIRVYAEASSDSMTSAVSSITSSPQYSTSSSSSFGATGAQIWTDGARKFSIASNALISQDGDISAEKISTLESDAFMGRKAQSVGLVDGIITVVTDKGSVYLK